ncbi:MAG: hypothetical protein WA655_21270 [Candidatus Korobacteraceae bacterium]
MRTLIFFSSATTFSKKPTPKRVGSPPCHENTTSSPRWLSMYWRMCASTVSSLMRNLLLLPGSFFFVQVIAIAAVEVADRPGGFHHSVKTRLGPRSFRGALQPDVHASFHRLLEAGLVNKATEENRPRADKRNLEE